MNGPTLFDVLVVYTDGIARSADSTSPNVTTPFSLITRRANYNTAYAYFMEVCAKNKLSAALTTSRDITASGTAKCYWLYKNKTWVKKSESCYSELIFDKLAPINRKQKKRRTTLFSNLIEPFNGPDLFTLFFDKQKTFRRLQKYTIPTVLVADKNKKSIRIAISKLEKLIELHSDKADFSSKFVLKDRYGAGGNRIFKIENENTTKSIQKIMTTHKDKYFVLQPFVKFDKGFTYGSYKGRIDIRIVYLKNKFIQAYIRTSKKSDFRCNEHQGGSLIYISKKDIPTKVLKFAQEILNILDEKTSLYALDFVVCNSGNVYLMEGNSGPGIDWNLSLKKNERMAKKLIRFIIGELMFRINKNLDIAKTRKIKDLPQFAEILTPSLRTL